jgi:hypothetical protein
VSKPNASAAWLSQTSTVSAEFVADVSGTYVLSLFAMDACLQDSGAGQYVLRLLVSDGTMQSAPTSS